MKFSLPKCCLYMPFADLETVKVCATQIGIGHTIEPSQGITITGVPVSLSPAWIEEQLDSMTEKALFLLLDNTLVFRYFILLFQPRHTCDAVHFNLLV